MINSRSINDLHLVVANKCLAHIANCKKRGVDVIVTSTLRDDEYQGVLYAQGRTTKGAIVTNQSVTGAHGLGLAYDVVPVINGVAIWADNNLWSIIGEEGKKLGMAWGGDWASFVDKPHFELTDGLEFSQLRSGLRPAWYGVTSLKEYFQIRTGFENQTIQFLDAYKFAEPLFTKLSALL